MEEMRKGKGTRDLEIARERDPEREIQTERDKRWRESNK